MRSVGKYTSAPLAVYRCTRLGTDTALPRLQAPSASLYYRAVLQVFLRDRLGTVPTDIMVGRLARKAKDYLDYMHMALSKFPLDHRVSAGYGQGLLVMLGVACASYDVIYSLQRCVVG